MEVNDIDIFACYQDLWKTKSEKRDTVRQGIISDDSFTGNRIKLRINAKDKSASNPLDNAIAHSYRNKFVIPFDFEMLDSAIPYYQSGLRNRLCYEIKFNEHGNVIKAAGQTPTPDATYEMKDIALQYEIVTQLELARNISEEYQEMVLLYDRVIRHSTKPANKSDMTWNWSFNDCCKPLKGVLVLFKEEKSFIRDTSKFYNPKIEKVSITVGGKTGSTQ